MSKTTENYGLTKPEVGEFFSLETWNENMDKIDGELKKREDAQKESDNSLMNPKFTEAKERKNLTSGEKIHLMLGKISRFFSDMKAIAFSGSYNDLVDKPKIPTVLNNQTTTEEGYALDARQANPNIDGTLAKQVADLNGSLKEIKLTRYNIEGIDTSSVQCFVKNNVAYVNVGVYYHPKEAITGWTKIVSNFPIPAYTKQTFIHYSQNASDEIAGLLLNGDGELLIKGGSLSYTEFMCTIISYPTK